MTTPPTHTLPGSIKIPIHVSAQRAYIWSADDAQTLRVNHHICGILVGSLPSIAQQNVFLGLPLLLSGEEVVVLVDAGIASIIDDTQTLRTPTSSEISTETADFLSDIRSQQATAVSIEKEKRTKALGAGLTDAQREKREKRAKEKEEKRRALREAEGGEESVFAAAAAIAAVDQSSSETSPVSSIPTQTPTSTLTSTSTSTPAPQQPSSSSSIPSLPPSTTPYQLFTPSTSSSLSYYDPSSHTYHTIESAREAGIWSFPRNKKEMARVKVFKKLWERGYFMGGGIKFGGELMAYPGDPLRYHSHFVTTALPSPDSTITPMEIVAWGRLGTATKKSHLICSWDEKTDQVDFYSLEWASF
ncbi:tRNA splicing endonuclease [Phaffia rhodozyma]|uniref:tRNA-splicing endonuclease subunit Sen34 n=1 Tax=Phaffia rhodozyma TaxID=264483 RepID=A0A0F7SHH4_PHARH|nr:tRNA splicing endonuclease [Phaffia rhodozyma]